MAAGAVLPILSVIWALDRRISAVFLQRVLEEQCGGARLQRASRGVARGNFPIAVCRAHFPVGVQGGRGGRRHWLRWRDGPMRLRAWFRVFWPCLPAAPLYWHLLCIEGFC